MENKLQARLDALTQEVVRLRQELARDKQAEANLLEHERRYRAIFDDAAIGLAQIAADGRFLVVNRQFCHITGYSRKELLHLTCLDITHPDDRQADRKLRERILDGEIHGAASERRYVRKSGEAIWVKLNLSAARRDTSGSRYLLAAIENTSERRSLQESLGRIVTNLAQSEGVALGGTWEWNIESDEIHTSPELLHLFSLPLDHPPPSFQTFLEKVHPDDKQAVLATLYFAAANQKQYQLEFRLAKQDGTQCIVSARGEVYRRNEKGEPVVMIGTVQDITARKRADQALRESEQRFRELFDNAVDGIFIADAAGTYTDANRSACAMLGYSRDELIGKRIVDLVPEADLERLASARAYLLRNAENVQLAEWELKHRDGRYFPVEISTRILPDGRWMAIVRDISQRKRTEQQLERYAAEIRDLYDNAPCGYHSLDREGTFVQINLTELRWLGYDAAELIGRMKFTDIVTEEGKKIFRENFPRFLKTGSVRDLEFELVRKDGSRFPVLLSASAVYDEEGNVLRSRTTLFDMSELAETQKRLRQAAAVFEHTNDAIIITDREGVITAVNNAFSKITGYAPEEVIGKTPRLLKSEWQDDEFYRQLWRSLETEGAWQGEIRDRRKSGEFFPAWENITAVKDESGKVTDYISVFSDITTIKETEQKLIKLAYHDALTGLPNRLLFNDRLAQALAHAKRHGTRTALLLLDLDRFKLINDTLGHAAGDQLLQVIASRLNQAIRHEDTVARLGGDEFAIVLAQPGSVNDAALLAQKVVRLVAEPVHIDGQVLNVSTSVGISIFPDDAGDCETLAKYADMAMYGAKQGGRNAYAFYAAQMTDAVRETLAIDRGLRDAVVRGELQLLYQPQVDLASGRIAGIEALIRWHRPDHGLEAPARFISIAEESDLIETIGDWVLQEACACLHRWHRAGAQPVRLAVNLSARQLRRPHFVDDVRRRLAAFDAACGFQLDLEITETMLQTEPAIVEALQELKKLGLQIAIDDFGTGYSSLNSLKHLPVDILKIDRSFIDGIPSDAGDTAITSAIIAMGHSLGMTVIAEGIETPEQLQFVIEQRCDQAQGYFFFPPLHAQECERLLISGQPVPLLHNNMSIATSGRHG